MSIFKQKVCSPVAHVEGAFRWFTVLLLFGLQPVSFFVQVLFSAAKRKIKLKVMLHSFNQE
jgi:hypothetical protein